MKTKNLLLFLILLTAAIGAKADPKVITYGWDNWTSAKVPSARTWAQLFSGDDRLVAHRHYTYSFAKEKVNGVQCITLDFEDNTSLAVKIPRNLRGATVTIEGFAGIDDSYSEHKGFLKVSKAYNNPKNGVPYSFVDTELLAEYAKDGLLTETGESYGVKTPFSITTQCSSGDYIHILGQDMYISKISVSHTADFNGSVKAEGVPLPGAEISLTATDKAYHITADENGEFVLPSIIAGQYKARVSHTSDYADFCTEINFSDNGIERDFSLDKKDDTRIYNTINFDKVAPELTSSSTNRNVGFLRYRENFALLNSNPTTVPSYTVFEHGTEYGKNGTYGLYGVNTSSAESIILVTHLRTNGNGELAFEAKRNYNVASKLNIYKMIPTADRSFEKGELIASFSDADKTTDENHGTISANDWTKVVMDNLTEDGWIGIELGNVMISDIVNSFPPDSPAEYNAKASYKFDYYGGMGTSQALSDQNPLHLPEGLTLYWYSTNNMGAAVGNASGIHFGTDKSGFAAIPVYTKGKAKLTLNIRSLYKSSEQYLNLSHTIIDENGDYQWDYLLEKLIDNSVVSPVAGEQYPEYGSTTLTAYLPEAGIYSLNGKKIDVTGITVEYLSDAATLSGKVAEGETGLANLTIDMKGPAGDFTAVSDKDGNFSFENVWDGDYELSVNTGRRKMMREIVVKDGVSDLDLIFDSKPEGYTEDVDEFENIVNDSALKNSEKWTRLPESAGFTTLTTALGLGTHCSTAIKWVSGADTDEYILVTDVKGSKECGGIRLDVACLVSNWINRNDNKDAQLNLYKMIMNEDGSFTRGELLAELVKDHTVVATGKTLTDDLRYVTVDFDGLTEDCYIGIQGQYVTIDNFVNYYVVPKYDLTIEVVDNNGKAVPDAEVTVTCGEETMSLESTDDGKLAAAFFADTVAGKTWTATATAPFFNSASSEFVIDGDKTVTLTLDPIMYKVEMTVADPEGKSIEGAAVTLTSEETTAEVTEAEGKFTATFKAADVAGKTWTATATAPLYEPATADFVIEGDKTVSLTLDPVLYNVALSVENAEGEDVEGAAVTLSFGEESMQLTADERGMFTASFKAPEVNGQTWTAAVEAHGYNPAEWQFTFDGEAVEHTFTLEAVMRTYSAAVTDKNGNLIPHATMSVTDHNGEEIDLTADGAGNFSFSMPLLAVEGVTYTAVAKADEYKDGEAQTFTLDEGDVNHTHTLEEVNSLGAIGADAAVVNSNGRLWISGDAIICDIQGRVIRIVRNAENMEITGLTAGIYLVNRQKVLIR